MKPRQDAKEIYSMAKHKKHKRAKQTPKQSAPSTPAQWQAQDLLAHNKARDAVELAKQFLKQIPGQEAEETLINAYQMRVQALITSGMPQEAHALAALAHERFPAYRDQLTLLVYEAQISQTQSSTGNLDGVLTELATAEGARQSALESLLARGLTDPSVLATTACLPAEHPLRQQAGLINELFSAVTSAPVPDGGLAALDHIPRQSPLAPWKLLIRALDALYRQADALAEANLARIPADSGPGRLVPVVRTLLGQVGEQASGIHTSAISSLLDKVSNSHITLRLQLDQLGQALSTKNQRKALTALQQLLPWLSTAPTSHRQTFLSTILHHWLRNNLDPRGLLNLLTRKKTDPAISRLIALTIEHDEWDGALILWDEYLNAAATLHTGPEVARILLHMANLFPADPEDLLDAVGMDSEREIQQMILNGELPTAFDRAALLDRARAADPVPLVFRALVEHYTPRDPKRAEAEAEAWRKAYPQDLDPLLYLVQATEQRGALRKSLDFLAKAEAINRVHPDVRQSRFRLLLASAERRLKDAKPALALDDLERLAQEARANEGDMKAYLLALSWAVAHKLEDATGMERINQTLATSLNNPTLHSLILAAVSNIIKIKRPKWSNKAPPSEAVDALARACELFRTLDRPLVVPDTFLKHVEKALGESSATQLHALCHGGLRIDRPSLTYVAAGQGLSYEEPHLHRFLLARGKALCLATAQKEYNRARQCLRVARELANRARDMEAVSEASAALESLPAWGDLDALLFGAPRLAETPPDQAEINRTLATERRHKNPPRLQTQTTLRKSRGRKPLQPRLSRNLFNDMLSFLDLDGLDLDKEFL
jgi:hypothetical protein